MDDELSFEEWEEFNDRENEGELAEFTDAVKKHSLEDSLSRDELELLFELWSARRHAEFTIETGDLMNRELKDKAASFDEHARRHERATRRAEEDFMDMRSDLNKSAGWQKLPPSVREELEVLLLKVRISDT